MTTRHSEYARIPGDRYLTPRWVYEALYDVEPWARTAMDVAPASEKNDYDFLKDWEWPDDACICTNPPYKLAEKFVRHALDLPNKVSCAFLLPHAWDAATSENGMRRLDLFEDRRFKAKYVVKRRIRWTNLDQKKSSPATGSAWFVWVAPGRGFMRPMLRWL